jgi:glutathione synthase/RimK-type ligase-like ATP-grasp enzyme
LLALRAVEGVGLDLAGVDLLLDDKGNYLVLEINGAVEFTADYTPKLDPFLVAADALLAPPAPAVAFAV